MANNKSIEKWVNQHKGLTIIFAVVGFIVFISILNAVSSTPHPATPPKNASGVKVSTAPSTTPSPKQNHPITGLPGFDFISFTGQCDFCSADDPNNNVNLLKASGHQDIEVSLSDSGDYKTLHDDTYSDHKTNKTINGVNVAYGYKSYTMDYSKPAPYADNNIGFDFVYNGKHYSGSMWSDGTGSSNSSDLDTAFNKLVQSITE